MLSAASAYDPDSGVCGIPRESEGFGVSRRNRLNGRCDMTSRKYISDFGLKVFQEEAGPNECADGRLAALWGCATP